jgi:hypothetical protein
VLAFYKAPILYLGFSRCEGTLSFLAELSVNARTGIENLAHLFLTDQV